jgi:UDP-N-acetylglucosamine pyrophosphorylase
MHPIVILVDNLWITIDRKSLVHLYTDYTEYATQLLNSHTALLW